MPIPSQTTTDVVNCALGLLGQQPIQNIDDPGASLEAYLTNIYTTSVRKVQAFFPWPELIVCKDLTATEAQTIDGYYQFPMPTGLLSIIELEGEARFVRRGNKLVCAQESARLFYIEYQPDPGYWSEHLLEAIYTLLAARLAMPLTQDVKLANTMRMDYSVVIKETTSRAEIQATSAAVQSKGGDYQNIRTGRTRGYRNGLR
jgi:hypothetical protein